MARWCRGAAYVPWHGSTCNSSADLADLVSKVPGRAVVQRKLEPSRDGPSVRPCNRHAGGAAIKRRRQSSSSCLPRLRLASCREPLEPLSALRNDTLMIAKRSRAKMIEPTGFHKIPPPTSRPISRTTEFGTTNEHARTSTQTNPDLVMHAGRPSGTSRGARSGVPAQL